jgi:hypothetical protein
VTASTSGRHGGSGRHTFAATAAAVVVIAVGTVARGAGANVRDDRDGLAGGLSQSLHEGLFGANLLGLCCAVAVAVIVTDTVAGAKAGA